MHNGVSLIDGIMVGNSSMPAAETRCQIWVAFQPAVILVHPGSAHYCVRIASKQFSRRKPPIVDSCYNSAKKGLERCHGRFSRFPNVASFNALVVQTDTRDAALIALTVYLNLLMCAAIEANRSSEVARPRLRNIAMRWPLRNQILLPMVGLMLAALVGVSVLNAYLSVQHTRWRIESDLAQVTETLAKSNFPLTNSVLLQMRGLAGAEFVLTDRSGNVMASSMSLDGAGDLPTSTQSENDALLSLAQSVAIGDRMFFHSGVQLRRLSEPRRRTTLHVLYPEESYRQAWRDVVYPPLLVGGAAIVLVIGLCLGIASRVTRPLSRLQRQVDQIATGNFRSVPVPKRNDEIADLSRSINRMAEMLAHYESEVRRNEQLRTLGQLGGGIAHQIRNSATGCRMAVELHGRECPLECESLDVAMRQLELMERFLQRFLSLGRSDEKPHKLLRLQPIIENVISLVRPTARHVGVALKCTFPDEPVEILGDTDALEQVLVNLVLNGVEAASHQCPENGGCRTSNPEVNVLLRRVDDRAELVVEDTGRGPALNVESTLFEPFVTEKPDGTGLGLAVAKEVTTAHSGQIRWSRQDTATRFVVDLPLAILNKEAE